MKTGYLEKAARLAEEFDTLLFDYVIRTKIHEFKGTSKNYVFRGGGVGRSPTHSPFAFRRKAKGEVFRGSHNYISFSC